MSPQDPREEVQAAESKQRDEESPPAIDANAGRIADQSSTTNYGEWPSAPTGPSRDAGAVPSNPESSPETFASFYERTRASVFRAVLAATGNWDRSREAVDEAFARAFARWEQVAHHPCPKAWVIRTARNHYLTWLERVGAHEILDDNLVAAAPAAASLDPELIKAIGQLPRRQREVVSLRYVADLTPNEIADVLRIKPKTVSVHHHRAMRTLKAMLVEGRGEEAP